MLHADTSLYHAPHPTMNEAFVIVPVQPRLSGYYTETLTWDLQNIRPDGANLVFRWGDTEVPIPLGIDPGYVSTIASEAAAPYVGTWQFDESMTGPSEEEAAEWRAEVAQDPDRTPEELASVEHYLAMTMNPRSIEFVYDEVTNQLRIEDPMFEDPMFEGMGIVLLPKAQGIFTQGNLQHGEIMFAGQLFHEFVFDEDGRAVSFEVRDAESDELQARGERR
jgi:hypothetical protein